MTKTRPIRFLVVDDDEGFSEMTERFIDPLLKAFPGSTVTVTKTVEKMLEIVAGIEAPDITLLDLTLPPSGMVETLSHLDTLEERTAVVIVTGQHEAAVRRIIGKRPTPIVEKYDLIEDRGPLLKAIYFAVEAFQKRRWARQKDDLAILKRVTSHAS